MLWESRERNVIVIDENCQLIEIVINCTNKNCSSSTRRDSSTVPATPPSDMGAPLDLGVHFSSPNVENNVPEARNIQNTSRGILAPKTGEDRRPRRNLRPRTERSYAETPDEPRINGYLNGNASDSDEGSCSRYIL